MSWRLESLLKRDCAVGQSVIRILDVGVGDVLQSKPKIVLAPVTEGEPGTKELAKLEGSAERSVVDPVCDSKFTPTPASR